MEPRAANKALLMVGAGKRYHSFLLFLANSFPLLF